MNMAKKDIKRNPSTEKIADLILNNYAVQNAKDVNEALKDVFGPIFEKMLNAEMDAHLGYDKSSSEPKETENRRNGYGEKTIHGSFGETTIAVPRDREGMNNKIKVAKRIAYGYTDEDYFFRLIKYQSSLSIPKNLV
jgi:transposase-like protein